MHTVSKYNMETAILMKNHFSILFSFFLIINCTSFFAEASLNKPEKEDSLILFCGNSNLELANAITKELQIPIGKAVVKRYNDEEINIQINENVRNQDVFVIQSTCTTPYASVNDNLLELYLMIRALKRASVKSVTAIIPYYGYARQDRKNSPRVPISAADIAMMLETAGTDRIIAIDLHCGQIQGFFQHIPADNLYASIISVPYFANKQLVNPVVISPDAGGVSRAKRFKENLAKEGVNAGFGIIIKQRADAGVVAQMDLVGDVKNRDVIIVDDICDTAGTLVKAGKELKKFGARNVYAFITHPVFSGPALGRIKDSDFTEVVVTDTIPLDGDIPENITQLSVAPLLAEVIHRLQSGKSVSKVFQ
ncbi:MAG: ribose-phosphate pyrophosphokinase [Chlamydiota bacterium]|nr:ribose-phosphate pyrophosphokinase [Chlamydiota bacterium]